MRLVQNSTAQFPGARIDGVGFQAHMIVGSTPTAPQLAGIFNRFVALGVEVAVTELDVRVAAVPGNAAAAEQQARDYMSVVGACLAVQKCVGLVVWQFSDKYSWVPSTFRGAGEACLYDENFNKKPAWTSLASQLAAAAVPTTPASALAAQLGGADAPGPAAPMITGGLADGNGQVAVNTGAAALALPAAAAPTGDLKSAPVAAQVAGGSDRVIAGVGYAIVAVLCSVFMSVFA